VSAPRDSRVVSCGDVHGLKNHPKSHTLVVRQASHYNVTACVSWNCILLLG
jgi:hypothetical protein